MGIQLHVTFSDGKQRLIEHEQDSLFIGTGGGEGFLTLPPDPTIAETHACMARKAVFWWVRYLGSQSGTWLNGQPVRTILPLIPGDVLKIGDNILRVKNYESDVLVDDQTPGEFTDAHANSESEPGAQISEKERIDILAQVRNIVQRHGAGQGMLDAILKMIMNMFSEAQRGSLILYHDQQVIPLAFHPPEKSHMSFTLAYRAIFERKAFIWDRTFSIDQHVPSLLDTYAAMYVPIIRNRQVHGVIHVDTKSPYGEFKEKDLDYLREVALAIGTVVSIKHTTAMELVPTAFISYSRKDLGFVQDFTNQLRRIPISVWYDDRLHPGEAFKPQLEKAIGAVDGMIVVLSKHSLASEWVKWEIETARAIKGEGHVIPVVIDDLDDEQAIPESLAGIQRVDIRKDGARAVEILVDLLYSMKGEPADEPQRCL